MSNYTEVFAWGGDHFGQLGLATKQTGKTYCVPRFCSFNVLIRQVACGEEHSAFIAQNGSVYTMGSNSEGRLGIGSRAVRQSAAPCLVDSLSANPADFISCGWGHTAVVCDGVVFTWGVGEYGALGTGSVETQWFPAQVHLPADMTALSVSCGSRHTAILVTDSKARRRTLLMTGAGEAGQLGTGRRERELAPVRTPSSEEIRQVSCGVFHTGFVTDTGRVYMMGGNSFGQLGIGTKKSSSIPTRVSGLDSVPIAKVACGHHSGAVSEQGELYLWGTGTFGELLTPQLVSNAAAKFVDVSVGGSFGAAVDSENCLWTWGSNTNGELGLGDYDQRLTPNLLVTLQSKRVRTVACGGSFCLALGGDVHPPGQSSSRLPTRKPQSLSSASQLRSSGELDRTGRKSYFPSKPLTHSGSELEQDRLPDGDLSVSELTRTLASKDSLSRRAEHDYGRGDLRQREMEATLAGKEREIAALRAERDRLSRSTYEGKTEIADVGVLNRKMEALHTDLEELVAENRAKQTEIASLRLANDRIASERDKLEILIREKEASLSLSRNISEKTTYSRRETEELLRRKDAELAASKADLRAAEAALSAREREAAADKYKAEVYSADKLKTESELAASKADLSRVLQDFEEYRRKVEKTEAENDRLARELDLHRRDKSDLKGDLERIASNSDNLQRQNEDLKRLLEARSSETASLRRELDTASQSRALLSSDYAKALSELDSLKQQSSDLRSLLNAREADLAALKQNYEGLNRDRGNVQSQLARLESDYSATVMAKEKLSVGLEQQLKVLSQVKMNAEDTNKRLESEMRRREEDYLSTISRLRESLEGKIEQLSRDLRQEREISLDLRAGTDNLENARRDTEDRLQVELEKAARLQRDFEQLRQQTGIRDEEANNMANELEDLKKREKGLNLTRDELQRELERMRTQANSTRDQISSLQAEIQEKEQELAQVAQENHEIKSAAEELKYEFEKLYQQHSDSLGEMSKLQEMNEELHEQLRRSQAECEMLGQETASLEAKNREIFHNFEAELANKARNFRERSLSALGTPSPMKAAPAASPSQDSRSLQVSTGRSLPAASPEKIPYRSAGGTDLTRKIARTAERLVENGPSPLASLRVSSPMRKQELASPQKSGKASPMRELHSFGAQEEDDLPQFAGSLRSSAGRPQDMRSRLSAIQSSKQALASQMEDLQRELQAEPLVTLSSEERFEDK